MERGCKIGGSMMKSTVEDILKNEAKRLQELDSCADTSEAYTSKVEDLWDMFRIVSGHVMQCIQGSKSIENGNLHEFLNHLLDFNKGENFYGSAYSEDVSYVKAINARYLSYLLDIMLIGKGQTFDLILWWQLKEFCEFNSQFGYFAQVKSELEVFLNQYNPEWNSLFNMEPFKFRFLVEFAKCLDRNIIYSGYKVALSLGEETTEEGVLCSIADNIL